MATHSCVLAWRIPWTAELSGLQSMGWPKTWTQLSDETAITTVFIWDVLRFKTLVCPKSVSRCVL